MEGQTQLEFWRTCSRADKKEHRAEQIKLFICVGINQFSLRKHISNPHTPMWANMGQVHKSIWVVRLVSSDSPWADLSEVFQLMRKISMHMRKHPFLWYKKGYTCFRMEGAWDLHPLEWNQELFPWNHESEEAKHLCSVRCYHMHKWDTGFCPMAADGTQDFVLLYEDAEFASSCPVVSSQL